MTRCLIVEDDEGLRRNIGAALSARGFEVHAVASIAEARRALDQSTPDLIVLDVALPDGRAHDLVEVLRRRSPTPAVVAMSGAAAPDETFELAQAGVRAFLRKPIGLRELEAAVDRALTEPPELEQHVRSAVGHLPIRDVEQLVRSTMVNEALARAGGSRRSAARVLDISRQLLQHILRKG
ncbi:MAG TPA: response regulator [Polyangiaceae bacterium]|nr:response regulator [Polyangiaceae bacterium]